MTEIAAVNTLDQIEDVEVSMNTQQVADFKKKSVSGAISYIGRSLFLNIFTVITSLVLGYYLLPSDFGIYGIVAQIVMILQFFSSIGLGPTLIQKKTEPTLTEYRTVFTVQQLLSWIIFFTALGITLTGVLTSTIGRSGEIVLLALAISFPLDSLRIISAIMLERKLDFSKLVLPSVCADITYNIVLLISVIVYHQGVISYAYAVLLRGLVGVVAMYWVQKWPIGFAWDKAVVKSFLSAALQFQASDLLAKVKDQLFYLFLGFFLPRTEFGYISWATGWSQMPYNLTVQNVIAITFPAYSRLQGDKNLLKRAIEKTMYFISLSIFPILAGMSIFIIPFTTIVVKYQKWQPALLTFILFSISIGWATISTPLTNTLNAIGQVHKTVRLMVMWTVLTWVLTPLCIWFWGFNGVAIAAFIISFTSVIPLMVLRSYVKIDAISQLKHPFISMVVMSVVGILGLDIWKKGFVQMFSGMAICGIIYVVCILLIGRKKLMSEIESLFSKRKLASE